MYSNTGRDLASIPVVYLNPVAKAMRDALANGYQKTDTDNGIPDRGIGDQSPLQKNLEGASGAVAVGIYFGIMPNIGLDLKTKASGEDQGDIFLRNAGWGDVKTSTCRTARLLVSLESEQCSIEFYVLCIYDPEMERVAIMGWAHRDEVFQKKHLTTIRGRRSYAVPWNKLRSIQDLIEVDVLPGTNSSLHTDSGSGS